MAERSYNGRVINTNPTMAGTGSTTTVNSWIGDASQGWGVVQTSSGTITECTYTTYLTEDCIKLSVTGMNRSGGAIGQLGISNTASYPGPTMSLSVLAGIAENVKPGKQYKLTNRYFISALAADTGSMRFVVSRTWYNSNGTRLAQTDSTPDTTVSTSWETYEETITAPVNAAYLVIRANLLPNTDPTTNGSGTVYVSDFRVTEVLPARTTATSRTTASNRVAVRDMGTALRFAGGTDKVQKTGVLTDFATTPYSFSLWLNAPLVSTNTAGLAQWIIGSNDTNASHRITLRNRSIQFRYFDADDDSTASAPQCPNKWIHIAATLDRSDKILRLYLNGTLAATSGALTNAITDLNTTTLSIGGGILTGLAGMMDEVRVWRNKTLTATEIQNLYLHNIVPQDGLVAEYLFDEASGTTAIDTSGNGNDGTITGATYTLEVPLKLRD